MKVLIISAVYPPEPLVSAKTSRDIAHALIEYGHDVTVVAPFPNRPSGRVYEGFIRKPILIDCSDDICKIRCFSCISKRSTITSRFFENLSFGISSSLFLLLTKKPDVIYLNTWPIISDGLIALVAKLRDIPLVLSIQDIYPESLASQHKISSKCIIFKLLKFLDGTVARNAKAVITISKRFYRIYKNNRGVLEGNLFFIPNWISPDEIDKPQIKYSISDKYSIPKDGFKIIYGGNIGEAAGVEKVIEVFKYIKSQRIYLIIAGSGSNLKMCKAMAKNLPNVYIISPWPYEETSKLLEIADIFILPTSNVQSQYSVPSKLIAYLIAGRPVLSIAHNDSDLADIIKFSGSGWIIPPNNMEALLEKIIEVSKLPEHKLNKMGMDGKDYALKHFSKKESLPKIINILERVGMENNS